MQKRTHTGLRTLGGLLLATSAWIAFAAIAQAMDTSNTPGVTTGTSTSTGGTSGTTIDSATLSQMSGDINAIRGTSNNAANYLSSIQPDVFNIRGNVDSIKLNTDDIKTIANDIRNNLGDQVRDVQTVTAADSSDPCVPGEVKYSTVPNTVIGLLSQILNLMKGPSATGACTAESAALNDAMGMAALARKDALARGNSSPYKRWAKTCEFGLNPTKYATKTSDNDRDFDQEAKGNKTVAANDGKPCAQMDGYIRWDRSLETLLGPLEYRAPKTMTPLPPDGKFYDRFAGVGTGDLDKNTYPMVAAAMFCMNVAENFFPQLPVIDNAGSLEGVRVREVWESKTMANCWRFFEERVAYPTGMSGDFAARHDQQVARCKADYEANIISEQAKTDCENNGRSTLKARADAAYRSDSETYTKFLTKGLKYESQIQILGVAAGDIERFEQSLALERQIMTDTLSTVRMAPLSSTTPMPDAMATAIQELVKVLKH